MQTKVISVERISMTSSKSFDEVVNTLEAGVGHPEMSTFIKEVPLRKARWIWSKSSAVRRDLRS
jgi:hypothetical protein